jgi:predicted regulator of Ras-like GTPase activity (Roadblock/LC7/MglB family)
MEIPEILIKLNSNKHVKGSMIISDEGIVVASKISTGYDPDIFAAFCSSIGLTVSNSIKKLNIPTFSRYVLASEDHKLFITKIEKLYLIVIADKETEFAPMNVLLYQIDGILRKTGRL